LVANLFTSEDETRKEIGKEGRAMGRFSRELPGIGVKEKNIVSFTPGTVVARKRPPSNDFCKENQIQNLINPLY